MAADLLAIGPFADAIVTHLDYPPWHYKGVREGDVVVTTLITCRTSDSSEALAGALGVGSMDLGRHVFRGLTPQQRRDLMRFMLAGEGKVAADCDVEGVDALSRREGWVFVYRPNG